VPSIRRDGPRPVRPSFIIYNFDNSASQRLGTSQNRRNADSQRGFHAPRGTFKGRPRKLLPGQFNWVVNTAEDIQSQIHKRIRPVLLPATGNQQTYSGSPSLKANERLPIANEAPPLNIYHPIVPEAPRPELNPTENEVPIATDIKYSDQNDREAARDGHITTFCDAPSNNTVERAVLSPRLDRGSSQTGVAITTKVEQSDGNDHEARAANPLISSDAPPGHSHEHITPSRHSYSTLSDRIGYVLTAVQEAGFEGLEDVLEKLYATKFTGNTRSGLACKKEQDMGWGGRIETFMDSMMDSVEGKVVREADTPYQRAILRASVPLYKLEFERFTKAKEV
jgi:hypothetical protein